MKTAGKENLRLSEFRRLLCFYQKTTSELKIIEPCFRKWIRQVLAFFENRLEAQARCAVSGCADALQNAFFFGQAYHEDQTPASRYRVLAQLFFNQLYGLRNFDDGTQAGISGQKIQQSAFKINNKAQSVFPALPSSWRRPSPARAGCFPETSRSGDRHRTWFQGRAWGLRPDLPPWPD